MDNEEEFILLTKDWLFEDFINDHDAMKSKYDQFEGIVLKISNIEYKYVRKGIDNGIKIEYYFELEIEDCRWFLVKIINSST
jgi:ribosomal protein L19